MDSKNFPSMPTVEEIYDGILMSNKLGENRELNVYIQQNEFIIYYTVMMDEEELFWVYATRNDFNVKYGEQFEVTVMYGGGWNGELLNENIYAVIAYCDAMPSFDIILYENGTYDITFPTYDEIIEWYQNTYCN